MSQGARFSPLGKKLVIVGNAQHRALRLRVVELIRAAAGFLGAIAPMPGIVKEGPIRHFPAVIVLADWSPLTCNNPSAPPMVPKSSQYLLTDRCRFDILQSGLAGGIKCNSIN